MIKCFHQKVVPQTEPGVSKQLEQKLKKKKTMMVFYQRGDLTASHDSALSPRHSVTLCSLNTVKAC